MIIKNKIAFITGASSGIGKATAQQFAAAGVHLLLCARNINALNSLALQLQNEYGIEVYPFELDVREKNQIITAFAALPEKWQNIDILINNAGLGAGLDFIQEGNIDDWEQMIDTNIKGLLYITKQVLPKMIAKNSGHIINIGSIAGHQVYPKGAVYCATKFAVNALSIGLRMDLNGTQIRVTTIDPGAVETNFSLVRFKGDVARANAVYEGIQALTPEDIADALLYCVTRPAHVNINEMIILPTDQASATLFSRKSV